MLRSHFAWNQPSRRRRINGLERFNQREASRNQAAYKATDQASKMPFASDSGGPPRTHVTNQMRRLSLV
eukprot:11444207-Alexandrium_andersonii.AAC.1